VGGTDEVTLRFVRYLPHPPAKVWRALTEPEHLAAWFPTTIDGHAARGGAGWHVCLDLLGFDLADAKAPWSQDDRWRAVHRGYLARFGPDAATIGPPAEWERLT
jgi:Activator of Hsp90 ATPase homolog 1-like protein